MTVDIPGMPVRMPASLRMSGAAWVTDKCPPLFFCARFFQQYDRYLAHILGDQARKLDPTSHHVWQQKPNVFAIFVSRIKNLERFGGFLV